MQLPLQISFRNFTASPAVEANIRAKVAHLEKFTNRIISCRVTLGELRRATPRGNLFSCHVDIKIPGQEIVAGSRSVDGAHKDIYVAIRDAFQEAARLLKEHVHSHRVRIHQPMQLTAPRGRVVRVLHTGTPSDEDGYGFLQTEDGREIYFHRRSVLNDAFEKLEPGVMVRFAEEMGDEGPQASTVEIVGPGRAA